MMRLELENLPQLKNKVANILTGSDNWNANIWLQRGFDWIK